MSKTTVSVGVPTATYVKISKALCAVEITKGTCKTVVFGAKEYVITGGGYLPNRERYWEGYHVTDLAAYSGEVEPLEYGAHWRAVDAGERDRCYIGIKVKHKQRTVVLHGPVARFEEIKGGQQITLF